MRPTIGITCARKVPEDVYTLKTQYVEAIANAGGLPVLLPATSLVQAEDVARAIDGLVLSGGGDVDPDWYGEEPHVMCGRMDPDLDAYEIALCRHVLEQKKPILGICRGSQVLNVAAGGDLYQDVPTFTESTLQHAQKAPGWQATHRVTLAGGSHLRELMGTDVLRVNSFHHQAVRRVAPGFRACAHAADGLIEAIERIDAPLTIGVQWHPERTYHLNEHERALFEAFVRACS